MPHHCNKTFVFMGIFAIRRSSVTLTFETPNSLTEPIYKMLMTDHLKSTFSYFPELTNSFCL